MDIQIQQTISEMDWQHLTGWAEQIFPEEGRHLQWSESSHHVIARNELGDAVGHIGFGEFAIKTDEKECFILGVGGVVVRPEYQGQRLPQQMFAKLHAMAFDDFNSHTFALFCPPRLVSYYHKFGYKLLEYPVVSRCGDANLLANFCFMIRGDLKFEHAIELKSLPW